MKIDLKIFSWDYLKLLEVVDFIFIKILFNYFAHLKLHQ